MDRTCTSALAIFPETILADFNVNDTSLLSVDLKNSRLKNGANMSPFVFSSHVGIGSDEHCLSGNELSSSMTSATVIGVNILSSQLASAAMKTGGTASEVVLIYARKMQAYIKSTR